MNADIIDNYNDLPLGKWVEIFKVCNDQSLEDIDRQVRILSIVTDKTEDEILDLPITEYSYLASKLSFLEETAKADRRIISKNYYVGKFELCPVKDIRKITTSQYIDFQTFSEGGQERIPELLSVLLVPKGKTYCKGYDILEVQDAIRRDMSVSLAFTLSAFFLALCRKSILNILTFSKREARKVRNREQRETILRNLREAEMTLSAGGDGLQM